MARINRRISPLRGLADAPRYTQSSPREEGWLRHQKILAKPTLAPQTGWSHAPNMARKRRLFLMFAPYRACAGSAPVRSNKEASLHFLNVAAHILFIPLEFL